MAGIVVSRCGYFTHVPKMMHKIKGRRNNYKIGKWKLNTKYTLKLFGDAAAVAVSS